MAMSTEGPTDGSDDNSLTNDTLTNDTDEDMDFEFIGPDVYNWEQTGDEGETLKDFFGKYYPSTPDIDDYTSPPINEFYEGYYDEDYINVSEARNQYYNQLSSGIGGIQEDLDRYTSFSYVNGDTNGDTLEDKIKKRMDDIETAINTGVETLRVAAKIPGHLIKSENPESRYSEAEAHAQQFKAYANRKLNQFKDQVNNFPDDVKIEGYRAVKDLIDAPGHLRDALSSGLHRSLNKYLGKSRQRAQETPHDHVKAGLESAIQIVEDVNNYLLEKAYGADVRLISNEGKGIAGLLREKVDQMDDQLNTLRDRLESKNTQKPSHPSGSLTIGYDKSRKAQKARAKSEAKARIKKLPGAKKILSKINKRRKR